jgi:putative colanic acid biosynthesis acetyltransferase WcaF
MYHNGNSDDAYIRPVFSYKNKLRRFFWNIAWLLLCRYTPNAMHAWRIAILRLFGAKIGRKNFVYPDCKIWAPWLLVTEEVVTIGPGVEIYNPGGLSLGHHSIISQNAFICGATHNYNSIDFTYLQKQIVIEAYVWICARAVVLPGVHCYEGAVLGAAAVASHNLEAWLVYAGNPAQYKSKRNNFLDNKQKDN